jgi:hypothetical protein
MSFKLFFDLSFEHGMKKMKQNAGRRGQKREVYGISRVVGSH